MAVQVENVTVVFTDMVDSTRLSSELSVEEADELRQGHFSLLRQAITASGGTEVKNLGDGVMVVFRTASAAISCAVAIQQAVDWRNRRDHPQLGLRVGISAGESTKEGEDYFGDPVIEAARLCSEAKAGQILAAEVVRVTARRRSGQNLRPLGPLELKGLPEPVQTFEVTWHPRDHVHNQPGHDVRRRTPTLWRAPD